MSITTILIDARWCPLEFDDVSLIVAMNILSADSCSCVSSHPRLKNICTFIAVVQLTVFTVVFMFCFFLSFGPHSVKGTPDGAGNCSAGTCVQDKCMTCTTISPALSRIVTLIFSLLLSVLTCPC